MIARLSRTAIVAAIGLAVACDTNGPREPGSESGAWRGTVDPGKEIRIVNVSGNISVSTTDGDEVIVSWEKDGDPDDIPRVNVTVSTGASGVTVRADYPGHSVDVEVDFQVEVPADVAVRCYTVSGNVTAVALESDVSVSIVSGTATISTTQLAEATVVSGVVDATIGQTDWDRNLNFSVQSGSLAVSIPSNANADVHASVVSGTITCDFQMRGTSSDMHGTVGAGGSPLDLAVTSGTLRLRAGPSV